MEEREGGGGHRTGIFNELFSQDSLCEGGGGGVISFYSFELVIIWSNII